MRTAQQLQTLAIAGGAIVAWAALFMTLLYVAGRIARPALRMPAKAAVWAMFLSPAIAAAGHGVLPAPPVVVVFLPGNLLLGLVQAAAYTVIYTIVGFAAVALRGEAK